MRKLKFSRVPWSVSSGGGPSPGQLGPFCALSSKCFSPHRSVLEALSQETLLKPPDLQSSYSSLSKKKKKQLNVERSCGRGMTHALTFLPTLTEEQEANPQKLKWLVQGWLTSWPPWWSFEAPSLQLVFSHWTVPFPTKISTSLPPTQGEMGSRSCFPSKPVIPVPSPCDHRENDSITLSPFCSHFCFLMLQSLCWDVMAGVQLTYTPQDSPDSAEPRSQQRWK